MSYLKTIDEIGAMGDTAIVPVGSCEQHGHHLPVSTDVIIAQGFADAIGERISAFTLPCLPISTAYEHKGKKGSVWMNADTFYKMLVDIVCNLKDQGYRKVVVIKGHGGIFVMDPAIRHLNANYMPELSVCMLEPGNFSDPDDDILENKNELHSGESETSLMLYLRPELVKMELAVDHLPEAKRPYLQYGSMFKYCPDGVWGAATLATAEKGKQLFDNGVEGSITYIDMVFGMMEGKTYGGQ